MKKSYFLILILTVLTLSFNYAKAFGDVNTSQGIIPEQYIVVLKDDIGRSVPDVANEMAKVHGFQIGHVYQHALKGFSAVIPDARLERVKNDPRVERIDADREVHALGKPSGGQPTQVLPTGVNRIDAELNTTPKPVDVDIAIIDTGIDLTHPDLNVVANVTFVSTRNGNDDNGHGSHVAGIAAAKDNGMGVVGVAPGARLWAVKVLDRSGRGSWSSVIAGVDYVTAHADQIEVANMSLGGSGSDTASSLRTAIENSVAAGVTYVVAAGNESTDAAQSVPAAYDSVITVSAIADSDGQPGGHGAATSYGADDTFASFSNFGQDVDIAAPGVDILSCYKGGGYATLSGTSMSTPHVTGAAALFIANHPGARPSDVAAALTSSGTTGSFTGDPDVFPEPLVNASNL